MVNSLAGPYSSVCNFTDQDHFKTDLKIKNQKNKTIETFNKNVEELTAQLCTDEVKLERYQALNKDLAVMVNTLKAEETRLKKENNQLRTIYFHP